jgi:hypothetical protein
MLTIHSLSVAIATSFMAAQLKTPAGGRTNPTFWAAAICRQAAPGSPCIAPADSLQSAIIATRKPLGPDCNHVAIL